MNPLEKLQDLKEELEKKTEELEEKLIEKKDEDEIERIKKGPGLRNFPGDTREQHLLYFYKLRTEDIENTLQKLREIETEKFEEKKQELEEQVGKNLTENPQRADRYSKAVRGLERAVNAIKGEEVEEFFENKYETSDLKREEKHQMLSEEREKATHTFLSASGLLGEKLPYRKQLNQLKRIENEDLEEADRYTEKIQEIRKELRKRAEIIDQSTQRASHNQESLQNPD